MTTPTDPPDPTHEHRAAARDAPTLPTTDPAPRSALRPPRLPLPVLRYFGDYELLEEVARGGMGVVYKARQTSLNRIVAVKMILAGALASDDDVKRFHTEAQTAANLRHPNIVAIHEVGQHEGQHYFSMDFIEGRSLADLARQDPLPARKAAEYVKLIAEAIEYAHQKGTLHRDLKPSNVLIDANDQPQVTDFGLARRIEGGSELTGTGQVLGTPGYMPPEQATGNRGAVGPASDVYALGAILYEFLTGRPPFRAETPLDTLLQMLDAEPVPPRLLNPQAPRDLETIALKCLEKKPERRYDTAQTLADELGRYLNGEPILARPAGKAERVWRWCRKKPVLAGLLATVAGLFLLVLVVGAVGYVGTSLALRRESQQRQRAQQRESEAREATGRAEEARRRESEQRRLAQRREGEALEASQRAEEARRDADDARRQVERERDAAERNLYVANIRLGLGAMHAREIDYLSGLLATHDPQPERPDLRGWEWFFLRSFCRREVVGAHDVATPEYAAAVAWSPRLAHLAVVRADGDVTIWDEAAGRELRTLHGARASVLAYHPREDWLATAGGDGTIAIRNVANDEIEREFNAHTSPILALAYHPNGTRIASGCLSGHVAIHDADSGQLLRSLPIEGEVRAVAWSPDGQRIAAASLARQVRIWHAETGQEEFSVEGYGQPLYSVAWSPDGAHLALAGWNGAQVWDWQSRKEVERLRVRVYGERVASWSPDGKWLAVGSDDRAVRLLDVATGETVRTIRSHKGPITALAWSAEGTLLASASVDKTVQIYALRPEDVHDHFMAGGGALWTVAFSPDGRRVAAGGESNECRVWNVADGREELAIGGMNGLVRRIAWNPDGTRLAIASYDATTRVCDATTGEQIVRLQGVSAWPSMVAWSPDGTRLASADWDGTLKIHNAANGHLERSMSAHRGRCDCVTWSPDGRYLASCGMDGKIRLWYAATGRPAATLSANAPTHVEWSPSGTLLAAAGGDGTITLWNAADQKELGTLRGHSAAVFQVAWHPDGRRLVSASADESCKLWDMETLQDTLSLRPEVGALFAVAWSPDGRQLAATGSGGTVRLWDASRGYDDTKPPPVPPPDPQLVARLLVDALFDELQQSDAVAQRLASDAGLSDTLRAAALKIAQSYPPKPPDLTTENNLCWQVVRWPGRPAEEYAGVLPLAETLVRNDADPLFLNTAGVAFYRVGRDAEALELLEHCSRMMAASEGGDHPANTAFLALARYRLGRRAEALAALAELRMLMQNPRWAADEESAAFFREAQWHLAADALPWTVLDPQSAESLKGAALGELEDHSLLAGGPNPSNDTYQVVAPCTLDRIAAVRLEVDQHDDLPRHGPGRHPNGSFVLSGIELELRSADGRERRLEVRDVVAEYSQAGHEPRSMAGLAGGPGWAVWQDNRAAPESAVAFVLAEPVAVEPGDMLVVVLRNESSFGEANIGRFRLAVTDSELPALHPAAQDTKPGHSPTAELVPDIIREDLGSEPPAEAPPSKN